MMAVQRGAHGERKIFKGKGWEGTRRVLSWSGQVGKLKSLKYNAAGGRTKFAKEHARLCGKVGVNREVVVGMDRDKSVWRSRWQSHGFRTALKGAGEGSGGPRPSLTGRSKSS